MNTLRKAIQLALGTRRNNRTIGRDVGIAYNTVRRYRQIAAEKNYTLSDLLKLDDEALASQFNARAGIRPSKRMPDWKEVDARLESEKDLTLEVLWLDYRDQDPDSAYQYSQYTHHHRQWQRRHRIWMRQVHPPGEQGYADFTGRKIPWLDGETGETFEAEVFLGTLGCSQYIFAYAVPSQKLDWWVEAHNQWYQHLGGVPHITTPDNLKSAVHDSRSDFVLNPTYGKQAEHYGTVIVPARPMEPTDKSLVEGSVKLVRRWAMARMSKRTFFSIQEINVALAEYVAMINERIMRRFGTSRRSRFEQLDRPALLPLPETPFEFAEWLDPVRVDTSHHVPVNRHFYSVPDTLARELVAVRITAKDVEIFHKRKRVARHARDDTVGESTTADEHRPEAHRAVANQTPDRYLAWAKVIGPSSLAIVEHYLSNARHPMAVMRPLSGLHRLAALYGIDRFEAACGEALRIKSPTQKSIRSILNNRLEHRGRNGNAETASELPAHDNIRGATYFKNEDTPDAE